MLLIAKIERETRLEAVKVLLELYLQIKRIQYQDMHVTVLAYYCLYGCTRETNVRIQKQYFSHLPKKQGIHVIYRIRHKLVKQGLLSRDVYNLTVLHVIEEIQQLVSDLDAPGSKLGAMIQISYEKLETDTKVVS